MAKSYKNRRIRKRKTDKRKTNKRKTNKRKTNKRNKKVTKRRYKGGATPIDYKGILNGSLSSLDMACAGIGGNKTDKKKLYRSMTQIQDDIKKNVYNNYNTENLIIQLKLVVANLKEASIFITNGYKQKTLEAANKIETDAQLLSSDSPPIESPPIEPVPSESLPSETPPSNAT
jgi:hypothetical protein